MFSQPSLHRTNTRDNQVVEHVAEGKHAAAVGIIVTPSEREFPSAGVLSLFAEEEGHVLSARGFEGSGFDEGFPSTSPFELTSPQVYRSVSTFNLDEPSSPTELGSASEKLVCLPTPPFYERGTSFNTMHGARRVLEVITRVLAHHDNCDFKQHAHKLKISGVVYINNRAHSFKVFVWRASEPSERLVEFQRRTGCAKSFHEFFKTVRDQFEEHFYENEEEDDDTAFRSLAVPGLASAFAGFGRLDSSAPASPGEPLDDSVDEPAQGASTLRILVEMAASQFVEERVQALRALCELTGSPVSKELLQQHGVLALAAKAISSRECEEQRLAAIILLNLSQQFPDTAAELCNFSGALCQASSSSCKDTLRTLARIVCSMCQGANANAAFEVASIVRQRCEVAMNQDPRLQHIFQGVPLPQQISCR